MQHVYSEAVGVVVYVAGLLWRRYCPKFIVVDWGSEVFVDGGDEVVPIKQLCIFGESSVLVVGHTCEVEGGIGDLVVVGVVRLSSV